MNRCRITTPAAVFSAFFHFFFQGLLAVLVCSGACRAEIRDPDTVQLVIRNIHIIDVAGGKIVPNQDVVITGDTISYTGNSYTGAVLPNTRIINGKGNYLCPGLWDMHAHVCWDKNNDTLLFPAFLKNGITGIRDMGGDLEIMQRFKSRIREKTIQGPEIFGAGPMIDGNPPVYRDFSLAVDEATNMEAILDSIRNGGAGFFKTYSLLKEQNLRAISIYCNENNFHFAGHLSEYIEPETSIALGQKSIEHLNRLDNIRGSSKGRMDSIGKLMIAHHTFLCPTLIIYQLKTKIRDSSIVNQDYSKYIPPALMSEWQITWKKRISRNSNPGDLDKLDSVWDMQKKLVGHLHRMGVLILGGTDFAGMPYVYPGISLHQELKLLVEAGLTNEEALKTVTINPAMYMEEQGHYGSVSVGKFADLIILEGNPLLRIENLKAPKYVIFKGRIFEEPD